MSKITPRWIISHFDSKKELEKYRYKTKYRRNEKEEDKYGEIDYKSYLNQRLNNNAVLPQRNQGE